MLQVFCIYHAYKNGQDRKWYFIILLFPLIGSLIYLYDQFYSKEKLTNITEEIKGMVNEDYRVEKLLKEAKYADTIANKTKLAEEFFRRNKFGEAAALFESCLVGFNADNVSIISKLMKSEYQLKHYEKVVSLADRIKADPKFQKSDERIVYAWSLHRLGKSESAAEHFQAFDVQFSHYPHRMEYASFLQETNQQEALTILLQHVQAEIEHMDPRERKMKKDVYRQAKRMAKSIG